MSSIEGTVLHKRRVSAKLLFFDIEDAQGKRREVLAKNVVNCEKAMKVGDRVEIHGEWESAHLFKTGRLPTILQRYSGATAFVSVPPPSLRGKSEGSCKYFMSSGKCSNGEQCRFSHEATNAERFKW